MTNSLITINSQHVAKLSLHEIFGMIMKAKVLTVDWEL